MPQTHLIKLSVGTEKVEDLEAWQASGAQRTQDGFPVHVTRMWPRREADLLAGEGSIYWVIKGQIQARQRILRLDEADRGDGVRRCAIVLEPKIHRVAPTQKRPFQGWRYLAPEDAPRDLARTRASDDALPPELNAALSELGLI
ncbi:DUF1489 family protein [Pseudooceanicola algae]|uniref:Lysophospholipase n=1 Tax=Pseudooceanicola algae TaxID=1537215 RepID=A0A418SJM0_9RHOB|nr:DUF1489 domain-containing protein [Pseudooceanicola algae]QPM90623.1 hypothetical protein PSAL_018620 [Pseudooceanicola algae]